MPPATVALWLEHAAEHQTRYYILVIGGVFAACGFALLAQYLTRAGGAFLWVARAYANNNCLCLIWMVYWGQFLPEAFRGFTDFSSTERPAWYLASRSMFNHIAIVEVALLYLATALFAAGLHAVKIFSTTAYHIHFGKHCVYAAKCSADGSARNL